MTPYDVAVLKNANEVAKYLRSIGGLIGNEVAEKNSDDIKKNFKNIIEKEKTTSVINYKNDSENEKENKKFDKNHKLNLSKQNKNQENTKNNLNQSHNTDKNLTSKTRKIEKKLDKPKKKSDSVIPIYDSEKTLIQFNSKGNKHEIITENKKKRLEEAEEKRNEKNKKKMYTLTEVYDKKLKKSNENEKNIKLSIIDKEKNKSLDYADSDFDADIIDLDADKVNDDAKYKDSNEDKKEVESDETKNRDEIGISDGKFTINQKTGAENLDNTINESENWENKQITQEKKLNRQKDVEEFKMENLKLNGNKTNYGQKLDLKNDENYVDQSEKLKQKEKKIFYSKHTNLPDINGKNKNKPTIDENKINRKNRTKFKKSNQDLPDNTSSPERNALKSKTSLDNFLILIFKFLKLIIH